MAYLLVFNFLDHIFLLRCQSSSTIKSILHLLSNLILITKDFLVLSSLIIQILVKLRILFVSKLQSIGGVKTKLFDQEESLNRFCLDLAVVVLEYLKVVT